MIGPGKAFDTEKYFVICSNVLGRLQGLYRSLQHQSDNGKTLRAGFPLISVNDMVNCQMLLVDHFGIDKLLSFAGGSMGGMQVLSWLATIHTGYGAQYPFRPHSSTRPSRSLSMKWDVRRLWPDPSLEVRKLLRRGRPPGRGLSVARMIGHITYMSDTSMAQKFGSESSGSKLQPFKFTPGYEVEGYLHYHGENFVKRFDANSYLYITKAIDDFDPAGEKTVQELLRGIDAKSS